MAVDSTGSRAQTSRCRRFTAALDCRLSAMVRIWGGAGGGTLLLLDPESLTQLKARSNESKQDITVVSFFPPIYRIRDIGAESMRCVPVRGVGRRYRRASGEPRQLSTTISSSAHLRRLGGAIHRRLDAGYRTLYRRYRRHPRRMPGRRCCLHCATVAGKGNLLTASWSNWPGMSPAGMRGRWNSSVARNQSIYEPPGARLISATVDLRVGRRPWSDGMAAQCDRHIPSILCGVLRHSKDATIFSNVGLFRWRLELRCGAPLARLSASTTNGFLFSPLREQPAALYPDLAAGDGHHAPGRTAVAQRAGADQPQGDWTRIFVSVTTALSRACSSRRMQSGYELEKVQVCDLADNGCTTWAHLQRA